AVANPKVKINTERMSFFMLCIASVLSVMCCDNRKVRLRQTSSFQFRVPSIAYPMESTQNQERSLGNALSILISCCCSVEKLMHQRPNPIHFFFQREMARVEKMKLCTGSISFKEFSNLHRKDSIVFAPSHQRRGRLFTEILVPIGLVIRIPFYV